MMSAALSLIERVTKQVGRKGRVPPPGEEGTGTIGRRRKRAGQIAPGLAQRLAHDSQFFHKGRVLCHPSAQGHAPTLF